MQIPVPESWKKFWEEWDLRAFIILSLTLQTILILVAPFRKRSSSNWVIMPLWSAYLLADWAANFAVGLISSTQTDFFQNNTSKASDDNNTDLLTFWAPFLLVHLGGPDTITAFALEDNELWLRHLISLVFQCVAAVYIFFQSLPRNRMWIPTVLMFVAGIIKYIERTRSLYLASLNSFRDSLLNEPDPGPNYAKLMDEYFSMKQAKLPTRIELIEQGKLTDTGEKAMNQVKEDRLKDKEIVLYAYKYFNSFKGLIVDLIFSFRERNQSRRFFLNRNAEDAFKIIEVELNLMYAALFTKFSVVYHKLGYVARFVSFTCTVVSLVLFYKESKEIFDSVDIAITYTLLLGAVALDVISFLMLIFSDWFFVQIEKLPEVLEGDPENQKCLRPCWPHLIFAAYLPRFLTRRWSESISQFNLIEYCLDPRPPVKEKFIGYFGLTNFLDSLAYVTDKEFGSDLRDLIFNELLGKSELADDLETAKEISSARGDWVLRIQSKTEFLTDILDVDYDQSLLLWHIATELCYSQEKRDGKHNSQREISKLLSDYMIYLLVMQPTLMSAVTGIGQIRFRDTCAEAKRLFSKEGKLKEPNGCLVMLYFLLSLLKYLLLILASIAAVLFTLAGLVYVPVMRYCRGNDVKWTSVCELGKKPYLKVTECLSWWKSDRALTPENASKMIHDVYTDEVTPVAVKGDKSKSVLFDGCILAKKLDKELKGGKWEIVSKVWVELLCYAASHCRASAHAQQLSRGGELVTIVWLLMAHLGLGDQFQINEGHARAKLLVGK